ncbi:hypothetical protein UPYG_G00222150 [Umbra pygmaea]|uniref:RING-type domain-containing protein n=1 Tax=Umbra pygmaea TaxID=75934 RepID=A0ABD0X270_UMBPY
MKIPAVQHTMESCNARVSSSSKCSEDRNNASCQETIEVVESSQPLVVGEEIVDLTREVFTSSFVDLTDNVDFTNYNDSVVIVDEGPKCRRRPDKKQYVLSVDEEVVMVSESPVCPAPEHSSTARSSETISCPICMDTYGEIVGGGRMLVSSQCGHLFCNLCIRDSLAKTQKCPTCRKKLNDQQCHPIYI